MATASLEEIERIFRGEYGRAVAILARLAGDLDHAEEAVQDAFAAALEREFLRRRLGSAVSAAASGQSDQ